MRGEEREGDEQGSGRTKHKDVIAVIAPESEGWALTVIDWWD